MLRIDLEYRKEKLFVKLKGELTKNTVNIFQEEVTEKIITNGINNIVLDLEKLDNIDMKGINILLYNYDLCIKNSGNISILSLKNKKVRNKISKYFNAEIENFERI